MSKEKTKRIVALVVNIIIWIFLVFAILVTIFTILTVSNESQMPAIGSKAIINIKTPSMEPTFEVGDVIISEVVTDETRSTLKIGDVITYRTLINGEEALNSHRIIGISPFAASGGVQYTTQGDNTKTNPEADPTPVSDTAVLAVWRDKNVDKADSKIGGMGNFIEYMRTGTGFFLCVILPLILFFLYELINLIMIIMKAKTEKTLATANAGAAPVIDEEEIKRRAIEEYMSQQAAQSAAANEAPETQKAEETPAEDAPEEASVENAADETADEKNTDSGDSNNA